MECWSIYTAIEEYTWDEIWSDLVKLKNISIRYYFILFLILVCCVSMNFGVFRFISRGIFNAGIQFWARIDFAIGFQAQLKPIFLPLLIHPMCVCVCRSFFSSSYSFVLSIDFIAAALSVPAYQFPMCLIFAPSLVHSRFYNMDKQVQIIE